MSIRSNFARGIALISIAFGGVSNASAAVTFSGLDENLEKNARALMSLTSAPCDTSAWRIQKLYRDADDQLRDALEALGHYRFSVEKSLSLDEPECWAAVFDVSLGEPVRIREVIVEIGGDARADSAFVQQVESRQPAPGAVLNHGEYDRFKKWLLSQLGARGYFDAQLDKSGVTVDESLSFADIEISVETGVRYTFGDLHFSDYILTPELLGSYADFRKGDPFDSGAISQLHEALSGSGYFRSVSIRAEPLPGAGTEVPVNVTLTPSKRRMYSAGIGYATDTGIQGRLGFTDRRRNDSGHQFDARLYLSQVDSELTGTYRWPRGSPDKEWVNVYGGFQRKRTDTSRSDKSTLGIRVARNRGANWLETPYLDFTGEDFRVGEQIDTTRLILPGIKWESAAGRELGRVELGARMSLDLRGAHDKLGSDVTFFQATAAAKWISSPGSRFRLLARADLGATVTDAFDQLPASVRFFTGGDNSVRGYGFETIGPLDEAGNVIGATNLAVFSLETDRMVSANWAVAAFVDTGSAFDDFDADFKTGIGLGVRWYSPVGPIRVDVAHPLDDPGRDWRLHITLGPDL